ncbi:MAG: SUMF1/EgtB/PvdO family nonheme iron enzyme [Myxococcota bacterium]|jgi:hypothetical protein|nr:SUMF1/EgtB/PvdO family nonheme iron enzyme [Myxococcota bacterium]
MTNGNVRIFQLLLLMGGALGGSGEVAAGPAPQTTVKSLFILSANAKELRGGPLRGYATPTKAASSPTVAPAAAPAAPRSAAAASSARDAASTSRHPNAGVLQPPGLNGCPPGMAPIGDGTFCMDRWEAHLVLVTATGETTPWSPFENPGELPVRAVSAPDAVPQGYINELQAAAACQEAGKRLCRPAEWSQACRGEQGRTFPYGEEREPGACNESRRRHPAAELFRSTDPSIFRRLTDPGLNQLPGSLARTGSHLACQTPEGIFDLMGNLHEWVDDPAGTFQGGYYVDTVGNGAGCLYRTTAHKPGYWDYSTGFRCCADHPDPAGAPAP